jgi:hypothetical protein
MDMGDYHSIEQAKANLQAAITAGTGIDEAMAALQTAIDTIRTKDMGNAAKMITYTCRCTICPHPCVITLNFEMKDKTFCLSSLMSGMADWDQTGSIDV